MNFLHERDFGDIILSLASVQAAGGGNYYIQNNPKAAQVLGPNAIGIMLTGMGADGAAAMREMKDAGSYNYVQDEASCVVFGMPRMAIQHGAAHEVLPLTQITPAVLGRLNSTSTGVRHRI